MNFDPNEVGMRPPPFKHTIYNALVMPRPVGWITTVSPDGDFNLAPYSFFNAVSGSPPCVVYCPNYFKPGTREAKDSLTNAEETGEFVYNMCTADLDVYRKPYLRPGEDRRPTLTWARNVPIAGEPADVVATVEANAAWRQDTTIPKVFIRGQPGGLIQGPRLDFCRALPNTREIAVPGIHYIQEDSPDEIGHAVASLVKELDGG